MEVEMEGSIAIEGLSLPIQFILLGVALVGVAFFSSSEASLISVNKMRIRHLAEQGNKAARAVDRVIGQHEKFFATILLTENAFIIFASSLGTTAALSLMGHSGTSVAIATGLMTVIIVTFGEITPKSLAAQASERWSMVVARPIELIMKLETALIFFFTLLPKGVSRLLSRGGHVLTPTITEGELRMLIDIGRTEGAMESSEAEMLERVFHFGDRAVREVMTPRTEIRAVQENTTLKGFLDLYTESPLSRFPVFSGTIDKVIGVLPAKTVLRALADYRLRPEDNFARLMLDAYFVPETKPVADTFSEMKNTGQKMAIVVDEYGGVSGVVTIAQLLEIIVGPVLDEGENNEEEYQILDGNTFQMDGDISIHEANEKLDLGLPIGDYQTVAGFILDHLQRIPQQGQSFAFNDLRIRIVKMDGPKVEQVEIRKGPTPDEHTPIRKTEPDPEG